MAGHVNRQRKIGAPLYCGKTCAGIARRINRTVAEKKQIKREYDMEYRAKNLELITAKKKAYFKKSYDPKRAAIERKKTMARHIEYCRQPEYRAWKKQYDRKYLAEKQFGDFADSALILRDIENEIGLRMTRQEIYLANGTANKTQRRKREYDRLNRN